MEADDPRLLDFKSGLQTALRAVHGQVQDQALIWRVHEIIDKTLQDFIEYHDLEGNDSWEGLEIVPRFYRGTINVFIRFPLPDGYVNLEIKRFEEDK